MTPRNQIKNCAFSVSVCSSHFIFSLSVYLFTLIIPSLLNDDGGPISSNNVVAEQRIFEAVRRGHGLVQSHCVGNPLAALRVGPTPALPPDVASQLPRRRPPLPPLRPPVVLLHLLLEAQRLCSQRFYSFFFYPSFFYVRVFFSIAKVESSGRD